MKYVFGLREKAGVPGEKQYVYEENMQGSYRKAPACNWKTVLLQGKSGNHHTNVQPN